MRGVNPTPEENLEPHSLAVVPGPLDPAPAAIPVAILAPTMTATKTHRVEVELPSEAFAHHPWEPDQLSQELRNLWLLEQVRQRRLAFTKAAELACLPLALFLDRMKTHKITPFDLDPEEVDLELR
jgi:predicted HTH domain antitoxin